MNEDHYNMKLSEKLPKDLAKAYNNSTLRDLKNVQYEIPTKSARRYAKIDLNAANYVEISKDEAKKIFRSPDKWKLRIILQNDQLVMYDRKTGKMLTTATKWYGDDPSSVSFDDVLSYTKKIYKTDEDEHVINRQQTQPRSGIDDFDDKTRSDIQTWYYQDTSRGANDYMADNAFRSQQRYKSDYVQDTGDHTKWSFDQYVRSASAVVKAYKRTIQSYEKEYDDILKSLNGAEPSERQANRLNCLKNMLDYTKKQFLSASEDLLLRKLNALRGGINDKLAKATLLKSAMNYKKSKFAQSIDDISDSKFQWLSDRAEQLKDKIKALQKELDEVNAELTPELKQQAIDKANERSLALGDDYLNLQAQFDALKDEYKKSE